MNNRQVVNTFIESLFEVPSYEEVLEKKDNTDNKNNFEHKKEEEKDNSKNIDNLETKKDEEKKDNIDNKESKKVEDKKDSIDNNDNLETKKEDVQDKNESIKPQNKLRAQKPKYKGTIDNKNSNTKKAGNIISPKKKIIKIIN